MLHLLSVMLRICNLARALLFRAYLLCCGTLKCRFYAGVLLFEAISPCGTPRRSVFSSDTHNPLAF